MERTEAYEQVKKALENAARSNAGFQAIPFDVSEAARHALALLPALELPAQQPSPFAGKPVLQADWSKILEACRCACHSTPGVLHLVPCCATPDLVAALPAPQMGDASTRKDEGDTGTAAMTSASVFSTSPVQGAEVERLIQLLSENRDTLQAAKQYLEFDSFAGRYTYDQVIRQIEACQAAIDEFSGPTHDVPELKA